MSSDFPAELRDDLLDDFYAECDELLGDIRTQLTVLEAACRDGRADPVALEALYRRVHSFKGISAIVGLRAAEQLAHAAEGVLRGISRGETSLTLPRLELLGNAAQRFEQIVTAHRLRQSLPQTADLLEQFGGSESTASGIASPAGEAVETPPSATATAPALPATAEAVGQTPGAAATGSSAGGPAVICHAMFAPSGDLDRRGININSVRARLEALGTIVQAAPKILGPGKIAFEFTLELRDGAIALPDWEEDGITLRRAETPPVAALPAESAPTAAPSSLFVAPSHIVRVDLSRLDDLMRIVGEMVIHRSRLEERIAKNTGDRSSLHDVSLALGRSLRELREGITRVRLVAVSEIFTRLPFVVRDIARETGKKVRLVLEGQETEIDKYLVERLKEPLLHLVRNAISHGVETPAERIAAGKNEEATLTLKAATAGQSVILQIRDDGRGIDAKKIAARAAGVGVVLSGTPSMAELLTVICRAGFSTRDAADRTSGRGVGMAVVHNTVRDLSGSLTLESEAGQWTQFTLRLPLTVSIAETFLVSAAGQTCAVPQGFVEEVLVFAEAQVRTIQQTEVISYRGGLLPIVRLRAMFGAEPSSAPQPPLLVLTSERGLCGLVVDKVHGQREVVVRAMQDPLVRVPGISGATELGDGRPVLILDPAALVGDIARPRDATTTPETKSTDRKVS